MQRWWRLLVIVIIGLGVGVYMLRPISGPARDLSLVGDAARGAQLIRIGGCVTCQWRRI